MDFNLPNDYDIFEVEKEDYDDYFFRLPSKDLVKTTPREGWTVYRDMIENNLVCGILSENIMAMPANRYFIFNFIAEERLGPHKQIQRISMTAEEYEKFLNDMAEMVRNRKENNNSNA